jgi:adenylate cyclase
MPQRLPGPLARQESRSHCQTDRDGVLAEFGSAVDALRAAVEFQQAVAEFNVDQPDPEHMVFRIGLHLGDLIVDGNDLYGDGVNIAARLEPVAPPGGIAISRAVRDVVAAKLKTTLRDLGELSLKNIEQPMQAFEVEGDATDWLPRDGLSDQALGPFPSLPHEPSIAVLAFDNMSGDPTQEYFSDGIAEDIITTLSKNRGIFVIARNSSYIYKGQPKQCEPDWPRTRRRVRPRGQRSPCGRAGPHHSAADRGRGSHAHMGRALRSRPDRPFRRTR